MAGRHQQIYGLDLVRFAAALLVTVYHLGFKAWSMQADDIHVHLRTPLTLEPWWSATWFGWIGVQVFFVISGFVIAYSAEGAAPLAFLKSRIVRLAPVMLIASTVCAVILAATGAALPSTALLWAKSNLFFPIGPWITGQIWTLPIEIAFYAVILTLLCGDRFCWIEPLTFGLAALSAAYWFVRVQFGLDDSFPRITQLLLMQHGCYFALGMLIWLISRSGLSWARVAAILLCVGTAYVQVGMAGAGEQMGYGLEQRPILPFAVWLAAVALIAASLRWRAPIAQVLSARGDLVRTAGLTTYPLYLLHVQVGGEAMVIAHRAGLADGAALAVGCLLSIAAAIAVARWLEGPVRRPLARGVDAIGRLIGRNRWLFQPSVPPGAVR